MKNNLKSLTAIIMTLIMLVNIFPISAFSAGNASMSLTASSVSGEAGDTVEVEISVSDNPGIASLKFDVEYADCLTLKGVTFNSAFGPYATTPPVYSNPQRITLISPFSECTVNGVLATLTFKIADDAPAGEYDISLSYIQSETYDSDFNDVAVDLTDGSVTVGGGSEAPIPSGSMTLTAGDAEGAPGETVEIDVTIANNPGIASLKFDVEYADCLTLEGVTFNSAFGPYATTPPVYSNPQRITLISPFSECTVNGVLSTLTFKIADDAPAGEYEISLSYIQSETYDSDFNDVVLYPVDGSVTVGAAASALSVETYLDCEYAVSGRVVTVSSDAACKVGYKSGVRYIALDALPNADGSYSFTAPNGVSEVFLVLNGDANLDGRVTAADIARINASKLGKTTITAEEIFAGDVDRNSAVNDSDIDTIKNAVLRISPLEW